VVDGKGGADQTTVAIIVRNVDRAPEKVSCHPTKDTTAVSGQLLTFWVNYRDPDGDVLHYSWKVDGVTRGSDSPMFQYTVDQYFSGRQTVDVFIGDGVVTVSQRWVVSFAVSVKMTALAAVFDPASRTVQVRWSTSHEQSNAGFEVFRSGSADGRYQKIGPDLIRSKKGGEYVFTDAAVEAGQTYYYKIVDVDVYGNRGENGPIVVHVPKPDKFALLQNYPNPFNPTTAIRYNLARRDKVTLSVYNALGHRMALLVNGIQEPGFYTVQWDGRDSAGRQTPTGVYLYRLESGSQVQVLKMVKLH
jgi:hypothetical protein